MTANMYSELREEARDHARLRNAYFEQVCLNGTSNYVDHREVPFFIGLLLLEAWQVPLAPYLGPGGGEVAGGKEKKKK